MPTKSPIDASQKSPLETAFDACIHCGMCLSACPTYLATGDESQSPRGRIHLSQALQEGRLSLEDLAPSLESCLGCMACETACPSQVKYHHVLESGRHHLEEKGLGRFRFFAQVLQAVLNSDAVLRLITLGMQVGDRLGMRRVLQASWVPVWMRRYTRFWMPIPTQGLQADLQRVNPQADLALHLGCVMKHLMPDVHNACLQVLTAMGYTVGASPLGCCGALASHHALDSEMHACLNRNAKAWQANPPTLTLSNAGGCGAMLKEYAHLGGHLAEALPLDAMTLKDIASHTQDIHAFVAQEADRLPRLRLPVPMMATYQASCHLAHVQGVHQEALQLLARIENLTLVPLSSALTCCGSAGVYNLEHPKLAEAIGEEKVRAILATKASIVLVGNPGCLIQLKACLQTYAPLENIQVVHPFQLMAMALKSFL